jgi:uncharacterized protein YndB with AHSA1/START domain
MADLRHQILVNAAPPKVYAAIATSAGLRGWWTADSQTEDHAGGKAEFGFDKRGTVFRMKIANREPDKRLVWTCHGDDPEWKGTTLTWELSPKGEGTTVRFAHGDWKSENDYYAMCNSTWGELMYRLKDFVEGKNPGPHWKE